MATATVPAPAAQLTSYTTWMADLAAQIGPLPLNKVALPGSHDTATYGITASSDFSPDEPSWLQIFDGKGIVDRVVRKLTAGWARTQGNDISQQLADGIRYLDLRICENPDDGQIYTCHGLYSVAASDVVSQVAGFIAQHPKEIVILDFNHFYAISDDAFTAFGQQLIATFGDKLVPAASGAGVTLDEIWQAGQQVVVLYHGQQQVCGSPTSAGAAPQPQFWSQDQIQSCWPDAQDLDGLQTYLGAEIESDVPSGKLWVLQGILTENAEIVLKGLEPGGRYPGTMEEWAATTTPNVVEWITDDWSGDGLNIVIVDWYEGTSYVSTVVSLNQQ